MASIEKKTFCRVCEPACGLIATVDGERLVALAADKAHPISKGFVCNKGIYGLDIHNDPDRLRTPLRRTPSGVFEEIGWETALAEISSKLRALLEQHGATTVAAYQGNPGAFNTLLGPSFGRCMGQLGVRKFFSSGTQDCANKFAGSEAVFGTRTLHPLPDIDHSDFILLFGENPAVSHMSFVSIPHPMKHLQDAEARGARVLYVNPRRIESASGAGEVLKIKPDTDVYLLAAMLHSIDSTVGFHRLASQRGRNLEALRRFVADYPPEKVAPITGIDADTIRAVARDFARAERACVHMSTGVNMGRQGTLAYWLLHMLSLVTGNLGQRGGNFYSKGFYERAVAAGSRVPAGYLHTPFGEIRKPGGVGINLPGNLMADYIRNPDDPVRALFVSSGNPVLSIGGEQAMRDALAGLELLVCVDIYRNATAEYAHYVLPAAGAMEREDINITGLGLQFQPSVQFTEAMVPPQYERKPDWWIWEKLSQHMDLPSAFDAVDAPDMWSRVDAMLRSQGRSMAQLRKEQIIALERANPDDFFDQFVQHEDGLIDCCPTDFDAAIARMATLFDELRSESPRQLKLITKRTRNMMNSWYANIDKLKQREHASNCLFMHPDDAEYRQIRDGDAVQVSNRNGRIATVAKISDEMMPGVVAMTHGWGHDRAPGMRVAQNKPGVNCNVLLPSGPNSFEPLSNQAHMTGVPVEVSVSPEVEANEV